MNEDEIRERYRGFAEEYNDTLLDKAAYRLHTAVAQLVADALRERNVEQPCIADLGCGTGLSSELFFEHGWRVTGIDISPEMLEQASRLPFDQILKHNITEPLPVEDGAFDAAVITGVLELIDDPEIVLAHLHPKLKKGSVVGVSVPLPDEDLEELDIRTHNPSRIEQAIEKTGFRAVKTERIDGYTKQGKTVSEQIYLLERR